MFRNKRLVHLLAEMFGMPTKFTHGNVEVEYNCPHCDRNRGKYNMAVNTDNMIFQCWACGYKGKISKLFWDFGSERQQQSWSAIDNSASLTHKDNETSEPLLVTGFRSMRVEWTDSLTYRAAKRYLRKRKIGPDLIAKWDICYSEEGRYRDRIIIPSKAIDGKMEYFVARDIYDTQQMKYNNPPSEKSTVIFGEKFVDWNKPVVITEGAFDALVLYNAVPLLGSKIDGHKKLIRKIFEFNTPIILGFDEDAAGRRANMRVGKYLLNLGVPLYSIVGNEHGDLAKAYEMGGKDYIIRLIRGAQQFDELDMAIANIRS
jgi:hypothetical protein